MRNLRNPHEPVDMDRKCQNCLEKSHHFDWKDKGECPACGWDHIAAKENGLETIRTAGDEVTTLVGNSPFDQLGFVCQMHGHGHHRKYITIEWPPDETALADSDRYRSPEQLPDYTPSSAPLRQLASDIEEAVEPIVSATAYTSPRDYRKACHRHPYVGVERAARDNAAIVFRVATDYDFDPN